MNSLLPSILLAIWVANFSSDSITGHIGWFSPWNKDGVQLKISVTDSIEMLHF